MKHRWTVRRQFQETLDAQHRWDQAYQLVLAWSSPPVAAAPSLVPLPPPLCEETPHDDCPVCSRVHHHPGPEPNP
jgi:hypothetical protein